MVIDDLRGTHPGETAYIVGKGVSLEHLKREHIGEGFIIAISSAIARIEQVGFPNPTYSFQQDACMGGLDRQGNKSPYRTPPPSGHVCRENVIRPKSAILIVSAFMSPHCLEDYAPRIVWDFTQTGQVCAVPSSHMACHLAKLMGAAKIVFIAFDPIQPRVFVWETWGIQERADPIAHEQYAGVERDLKLLLPQIGLPFEFVTP